MGDEMASTNLIGKKEEISDLLSDEAYAAKDEYDKYKFRVGTILKFDYEGTITCIKITRIDRKNKKAWGQHVELVNYKQAAGHYGHELDKSEAAIAKYRVPFCLDCQVPINDDATEDGEKKYRDRLDNTLEDGTPIE